MDEKLQLRVGDVEFWRGELDAKLAQLKEEISCMNNLKIRVDSEARSCTEPLNINQQCLTYRTGRQGCDLIRDDVDVFGAGFPCQDASALHSGRASSSHRSCVIEASLRTGSVVRHIFALVGQMRRARLLLLENVAGLASVPRNQNRQPIGPSNLAAVIFCAAKEAGFHIRAFSLNPHDFGVPQC